MKKKTKIFLLGVGSLVIQYIVNKQIFAKAKENDKNDKVENIYKSRFGQINYTQIGSGEPILLIHNTLPGLSLEEWQKNISLLSKNYNVYALDLLGYGNSDKPKITYSSYLYISLINDFILNVIKKPTNIVADGYSSAFGVVAHVFNPSVIKKIILISPTIITPEYIYPDKLDSIKKFFLEAPILGTTIYNIKTSKFLSNVLFNKMFFDKSLITKSIRDDYYLSAHRKGENSKYSHAAFSANFLNVDLIRHLTKVKIPVHIIWGERDEINSIENYGTLAEDCPNLSLTVFEDTKSMPHTEKPMDFYKVCKMFFNNN